MSQSYVDKPYLLDTLRDFDKEILMHKYNSNNQPGKDAPTITDITINDDNTLFVTLSDGTLLNGGIINTLQGEKGDNGVTPHIDINTKHWLIGDIDTNIVAEGKSGKQGDKGESATINGVSTLTIEAGENIKIDQQDNVLTISAIGGNSGAYPVSIEVTTPPAKIKYKPGDRLDFSGMIVKAFYSDGSKLDVTSQCSMQPENNTVLTNDVNNVTINWIWDTLDKTYSTTQPLTMMIATGIKFSNFTEKTSYNAGETLDLSTTKVVACYPDGSEEDVTNAATFTPSNGDIVYEDTTQVIASWTEPNTNEEHTISNSITVTRTLSSITVSAPTKTSYKISEQLNLDGATVIAHYNSGTLRDVTEQAIFTPESGTTLDIEGDVNITASYTENEVTKTAATSVTVESSSQIVTWANGTDEQIAAMLDAHYAGKINIHDYWKVGDERTVHLSAMGAGAVGETHVAQNVTMVLMNAGGKTLVEPINGVSECAFIVGQKNCLIQTGYMNPTDTNSGGWNSSKRRTWCNDTYHNALPAAFKALFKQFNNVTANGNTATSVISADYFALPSEEEVFGSTKYANGTAEANNTQFDYYKTSANRAKKNENSGNVQHWWERSPSSVNSVFFCYCDVNGSNNHGFASNMSGIAPFGCI